MGERKENEKKQDGMKEGEGKPDRRTEVE